MQNYEDLISRIVWTAGVVLAALLASFLLSFFEDMFRSLFEKIGAACRAAIVWSQDGLRRTWNAWRAYWLRRQREFVAPILVELSKLRDATMALGKPAFGDLRRAVKALESRLAALDRCREAEAGDGDLVIRARGSVMLWVVFSFAVGALTALTVTNFWLLRIFFQQAIGTALFYSGWLQVVTLADMIAIVFPLVEVASGAMLHFLQPRPGIPDAAPRKFFGTVAAWGMLVALAMVELIAYGQLSLRFDMARSLDVDPASLFYPLAQYFMAPLGVGLTLGIAGLSYYVLESYQSTAEPRALIRVRRRLISAVKALETLKSESGSVVAATGTALQEAEGRVERGLARAGFDTSGKESLGDRLVAYVGELLGRPENDRVQPNAAGLLGIYLVLGVAWTLLVGLNANHYGLLAREYGGTIAWSAVGITIAGLIAALGNGFAQQTFRRGNALSWLFATAALFAIGLSVALAVIHRSVADSVVPNVVYGLVLPVGLMFCSYRFSIVFQGAVMAAMLGGAAIIMFLHCVLLAFAYAVQVVAWVLIIVIHLLCVPGRAMRRRALHEPT